MARNNEEYDWLNDPFDDKKAAEELERARASKAPGCALAAAVVASLVFIVGAVIALTVFGA